MKDERENEDKKAVFLSTEKMKKKDAISDASGECFFLRRIVFFASSGLQPKTFTLAHWLNGRQIVQCWKVSP